jgi:aminoglycoside 6'-N-acetyltransferase
MPDEGPVFTFRPLREADLPMLEGWIARPHWQEWWEETAVEKVYLRAMLDGTDSTRPFIAELEGEPFAYVQMWFVADTRVEPWITEAPWLRDLPDDAVGVDLSIAEESHLGRGYGSALLRQFVARIRAEGFGTIVIDPDLANTRAVRAYQKAGFRPVPAMLGKTGDFHIMQHHEEPRP